MSLTPRPRLLLPSRTRIRLVLLSVIGVITLGTVMFHVLEGWSILDSLYVTVQTVTTLRFWLVCKRMARSRQPNKLRNHFIIGVTTLEA